MIVNDYRLPKDKQATHGTISEISTDAPPLVIADWIKVMAEAEYQNVEIFFPSYNTSILAAMPVPKESEPEPKPEELPTPEELVDP